MERTVHDTVLKGWDFHTVKIPYTIQKNYEVDFSKTINGVTYLCESKGVFWSTEEASKYNHMVKCLPPNHIFFFLFKDPDKYLMWSKKRKDGTRMTHGEWAEKNNHYYFSLENFNINEMLKLRLK